MSDWTKFLLAFAAGSWSATSKCFYQHVGVKEAILFAALSVVFAALYAWGCNLHQ